MFVGVGNDLPAALPQASRRLKILLVLYSCSRDPEGKGVGGVLVRSET